MTARYQIVRVDDVALRESMKAIAHKRRRFGYRRLHVLLRREGHVVNHKRLFRMYREEKLHVRHRGGRKRAIGSRGPMLVPMAPNQQWSLDFVADQLTDGRRFRDADRGRQLQPRMHGAHCRHIAVRRPGGAGIGDDHRTTRQAHDDHQRSTKIRK